MTVITKELAELKKQLIESTLKEDKLLKRQNDLQNSLKTFNDELAKLKEKHDYVKIKESLADTTLLISKQNLITDCYKLKILVDGLYFILKDQDKDYSYKLFNWLSSKYKITISTQTFFDTIYRDEFYMFDPESFCIDRVYHHSSELSIRYTSPDYEFFIIFPINIDLDEVLLSANNQIAVWIAEETEKKETEEYQEYLRLKQKYDNPLGG